MLAATAPIVAVLVMVSRWGVNLPYWDQWEFVPLLEKLHTSSVPPSELWAQHNEHRILFPRLVLLALASVSHWNVRWEQYVGIAVAVLSFLVLASLVRLTVTQVERRCTGWLTLAVSLMTFSMVEWENWASGWQLSFFLNILGAVVAAWALPRWSRRRTAIWIASGAAVVSALSLANGLLLLWLLALAAALNGDTTSDRRGAVMVALLATAITGFYLRGYTKPAGEPALLTFVHHPFNTAVYVLAYLGSPVVNRNIAGAAVAGAVAVLLLVTGTRSAWQGDAAVRNATVPWLFLAGYSASSDLLTALGRVGWGVEQALSSRYAAISSLFWMAALCIVCLGLVRDMLTRFARNDRTLMRAGVALLAVAMICYADSYAGGVVSLARRGKTLRAVRHCALQYETAPAECLLVLHPRVALLRERLRILKRLDLGPFHRRRRNTQVAPSEVT